MAAAADAVAEEAAEEEEEDGEQTSTEPALSCGRSSRRTLDGSFSLYLQLRFERKE